MISHLPSSSRILGTSLQLQYFTTWQWERPNMHIKYAASLKHLSNTPHKQPLLSKMSGASQAHGCQGRGLPILLAFVDLPAKMLCKFLKAIPLQMNFDTQNRRVPQHTLIR